MGKKNRKKKRKVSGSVPPGNRKAQRATNAGRSEGLLDALKGLESIVKKSPDHDTQQEAFAYEWPEPTSFEGNGEIEYGEYNSMLYPLSFWTTTDQFSRVLHVSYEAVSAILMFLLLSAIGSNVRVKQASGEWDTLGFQLMLLCESKENAGRVLWAMARVFLERKFLLKAALATGEMADGKVSAALEAKLTELYIRATEGLWPLHDLLNAIAALPKVPSGLTKSTGAAPNHTSSGNDSTECIGLECGDSASSIVPDKDNFKVNLNGRPHSHASSAKSDDEGLSSKHFVLAVNPAVLSVFLVEGSTVMSSLPYALVDWAPGSVWDARAKASFEEEGLNDLRNLLMRAFYLSRHSAQNPIDLALSDQARSNRDATYLGLSSQGRPDEGPRRSEDATEILRLATKIAALISLFESDGDIGEISVECWSRGLDVAYTLYKNRQNIKRTILIHPDASKAELLLKSAAEVGTRFTIGDILQKQCAGIVDEDEAATAVSVLLQLGWVRPIAGTVLTQETRFEFHPRAFEQAASSPDSKSTPSSDQAHPE